MSARFYCKTSWCCSDRDSEMSQERDFKKKRPKMLVVRQADDRDSGGIAGGGTQIAVAEDKAN